MKQMQLRSISNRIFLVHSMLEPSTASKSTLAFAKKWLENCKATHCQCSSSVSKAGKLPTRLIEILPSGIRLRNTRDILDNPSYVTLSHCVRIIRPILCCCFIHTLYFTSIILASWPDHWLKFPTIATFNRRFADSLYLAVG